ncbi:MAG: hypothetical protein AB8G95_19015 [Anaerolineae bacterium]
MSIRRLITTAMFIGVLLLLIGCSTFSEEFLGRGYLGDTPCNFPCWQGITPNETNKEELEKILNDSSIFYIDTLELHDVSISSQTKNPVDPKQESVIYAIEHISSNRVAITMVNNVVEVINLNIHHKLLLEDALGLFESTGYISVDNETHGPRPCYQVFIMYPQTSARIVASGCGPRFGRSNYKIHFSPTGESIAYIHDQMQVETIILSTSKSDLETYLLDFGRSPNTVLEILKWYEEWTGFGYYPMH